MPQNLLRLFSLNPVVINEMLRAVYYLKGKYDNSTWQRLSTWVLSIGHLGTSHG